MRIVPFAVGLVAGALFGQAILHVSGQAIDYRPVSVTATGATWSYGKGTQGVTSDSKGRQVHHALVRREHDGQVALYRVEVPVAHCGQARGDVVLIAIANAEATAGMFERSGKDVGSTLAQLLCAAGTVNR